MDKSLPIAIIGCGLGGAATAAMLQQAGHLVTVFEQSDTFAPAGAGIHLTPNVMRILDHVGVGAALAMSGCTPKSFTSRSLSSDAVLCTLPLGAKAQREFGASYLTVARGTLHSELVSSLNPNTVKYGKQLVELEDQGASVRLRFADGSDAEAACVVGADGLGSRVREILQGHDRPRFSGQVAYRATLPANAAVDIDRTCITKWWGEKGFVVAYATDPMCSEYYFVAGTAEAAWIHPEPWVPGDPDEMLAAFEGSCEAVLSVLREGQSLSKWPLFERPPLQQWGRGRVALLGDACHAMRPHMAQGAAAAIEDGAVLLRCLEAEDDLEEAFWRYAETRRERTTRLQAVSAANTWLREPEDPSWVFGYDAMDVDLAPRAQRVPAK